jgi:N-acyl-L-homoserine lactone synthetase
MAMPQSLSAVVNEINVSVELLSTTINCTYKNMAKGLTRNSSVAVTAFLALVGTQMRQQKTCHKINNTQ